jgi:hypothetical protein
MKVALPMLAMETGMKTKRATRDGKGFTRMELVVVICVLTVLAAVFLPALGVGNGHKNDFYCVNNLKQIGLAFRMWGGDNGNKFPMQVSVTNGGAMELAVAGSVSAIFRVLSNELVSPKVLVCPADTGRHYATNFMNDLNHQTISYFVALDAEDKYPQMILSGDDNLEINGVRVHSGILNLPPNTSIEWTKNERHWLEPQRSILKRHLRFGTIGLAEGSVQISTVSGLKSALVNTGAVTNRFVIP